MGLECTGKSANDQDVQLKRGKGATMHISQLVNHIYDRMNDKKKINEDNLNGFLDGIKNVIVEFLEKERKATDSKTIRMSSIGRPNRKIWLDIHEPERSFVRRGSRTYGL